MTTKIEVNLSKPKIRETEDKQIIFIPQKGSYQAIDYSAMFQKLWGEVKRQGLYSAGIENLAIFYDDPSVTPVEELKTDVCLRVVKPAQPNDEIGVKTLKGGKYAVFTYIGAYENLCLAYEQIYTEWFLTNQFKMGGNPCYEKYVSDPRKVAPEKLKTEIYISIE